MTETKPQEPRIVADGQKCAACGNLLSERQVRINGRCRVCMTKVQPEPRIVAECWTCKAWGMRYVHWRDSNDSDYRSERENRCIAAGHDVRPVEVKS